MSPSRKTAKSTSRAGGARSRLQTLGLFATLLAVAALVGSLAYGLRGGGGRASEAPPRTPQTSTAAPAARVRVEVLNASGRSGLAREATRALRDRGFDVVYFGNAPGEFGPEASMVLDRRGSLEVARQVAAAAGIERVSSRPDTMLHLDATVVLGRDWRVPTGEVEAETAP